METVALIIALLALIAGVGSAVSNIVNSKTQNKKNFSESGKLDEEKHQIAQETKDLIDLSIQKSAKILTDDLDKLREDLQIEKSSRHDCDAKLAEANLRIDEQGLKILEQQQEIDRLNREIAVLKTRIKSNTDYIREDQLQQQFVFTESPSN